MSKTELIRQVYRDFTAGNAPAILERFDDDVEFRLAEHHPYRGSDGAWIGKEAVLRKFFAVAGPEWTNWTITVLCTHETAEAVIVEGRYTGTYKPTGRAMDVEVCHIWRFRADKVSSFHQYADTDELRHVMTRAPRTDDGR